MAIRVLVADDSDSVLKAMCSFLHEDEDIIVVGEATSFQQVMNLLEATTPDVLVLDLSMPERNGYSAAHVKSALASVCTVAVSVSNDKEAHAMASSYGAELLIDKMNLYADLVRKVVECHGVGTADAQDPMSTGDAQEQSVRKPYTILSFAIRTTGNDLPFFNGTKICSTFTYPLAA